MSALRRLLSRGPRALRVVNDDGTFVAIPGDTIEFTVNLDVTPQPGSVCATGRIRATSRYTWDGRTLAIEGGSR